ncbi:MAG: sulfatase [Gammaproteobacteria bacterium]|nr:sulfatase [Gammaproteobacteria bacterium]
MMHSTKPALLVMISALVVSGCGPAGDPSDADDARPNIIIILADDLGYGDVAAYGSEIIETPNIDSLARSGVQFTNGYVAAAVCSPSRAAIMTGRYPQRFGYHFNDNARQGLPATEVTLAERMKEAGYATGMVGKWQLGFLPDQRPHHRGFDEFFGVDSGTIYIEPSTVGADSWARETLPETRQRPIYRGDQVVEEKEYLTDALTREAIDFIERHRDERFFLYLAHRAPDTPLQATKKYLDRYSHIEDRRTRIYSAMVSALDDSVGAVLAKLEELGLSDDTLVIFLSDNGCALYLDGACSNGPLNGGKRYQLEGGIRVPFIMRWPDHVPVGEVYVPTVSSMDIFPTVVEAAGIDTPNRNRIDGVSLLPFIHGERTDVPHDILFWAAGPNRAARVGDWKLWEVNRATEEQMQSMRPPGRLFTDFQAPNESPNGQITVLYDLLNDVGETRNLTTEEADKAQAMSRAIDKWNEDMLPPSVQSTRGTGAIIDGQAVELIF